MPTILRTVGRAIGSSAGYAVEATRTAAAYTGGLGEFGAGVKSGYADTRAAFAAKRQAHVAQALGIKPQPAPVAAPAAPSIVVTA
jgi:hypothetical protein